MKLINKAEHNNYSFAGLYRSGLIGYMEYYKAVITRLENEK